MVFNNLLRTGFDIMARLSACGQGISIYREKLEVNFIRMGLFYHQVRRNHKKNKQVFSGSLPVSFAFIVSLGFNVSYSLNNNQ
ncbi:MAG TPA: hypothetical protein DCM60_08810 [Nitrospina sp.]|nr:hypothetical protein [Nitrospina sp.]